jgi:hypothetical protein
MQSKRVKANSLKSVRRSAGAWLPFLLVIFLLLSAACRTRPIKTIPLQTSNSSPAINRHQPEQVLRAYFDAWAHNDDAGQKSFLTSKWADVEFYPEPVESLHLVLMKPVDGASATTCDFDVSFEIKFQGRGFSMESGAYTWRYYLTWDATRESWLVADYGPG